MIAGGVARAPRIAHGFPRKSPKLWLYRNTRTRAQTIGDCVGESGAAMGETSLRTPNPMPASRDTISPLPPVNLSALWVYYIARKFSREHGRPISGEGAIVSDALAAVVQEGHILYDAWPSTPENYSRYNDTPPPGALTAKRIKVAGEAQLLDDADHILEYLGAGYSVWVGVGWKGGNPNGSGIFSWGGWSQGGHAVELLGYDLDNDLVAVGNSWDPWGVMPGGYAYTKWSALKREFTAANLSNGTSEACVITELAGVTDPVVPPDNPVTPTTDYPIEVIIDGRHFKGTVREA